MTGIYDNPGQITQIARAALSRMTQWKISLLPKHYHLWFEYFWGENALLVADVDELVTSGKDISTDIHEYLYDKYIGDTNRKVTEDVQKDTQRILTGLVEKLLDAGKGTDSYQERLEAYSQRLARAKDPSEIQRILEGIIRDNQAMAEANRTLQRHLVAEVAAAQKLKDRLDETRKEALTDALTLIHNRKAFDLKLDELMDIFKRKGEEFSVLLIDLDLFKRFNETYGRPIGDAVLRAVASTLSACVGPKDFVARYGGEEFTVLMPGKLLKEAKQLAETIRVTVTERHYKVTKTGQPLPAITVSIGVSLVKPEDDETGVVERADVALCFAKADGRDRVKTERDLLSTEAGLNLTPPPKGI